MNTRTASLTAQVVIFLSVPVLPAPARGQTVRLGAGDTLTIGGFIDATMFTNRGLFGAFGQGQDAEYAALPANQPSTDPLFTDGDVRNTRLRLDFSGAQVLKGWAPKAALEVDFFGGRDAPPFGDEQPRQRIRLAYADLTNGRTTVRFGQYWSPFFAEVPVSVTHIAFPLGYGAAGMVGWRFPGIFLYRDLNPGKSIPIQLQLAAFEGSGPAANASDVATGIGNGEASGLPQLEGRVNFSRKTPKLAWSGYAVGHVDWKDINGTGVAGDNLTSWGLEGGGNIAPGHFTLHGNIYYGRDLGQQFGHITQQGDIRGWGGWAQAGYDFTPHLGAWLFYGSDQPDADRFRRDTGAPLLRQLNHNLDALVRFKAGRYALGAEYFGAVTQWSTGRATADQYALSVMYTL